MKNRDYINSLSNKEFAEFCLTKAQIIGRQYTRPLEGLAAWLDDDAGGGKATEGENNWSRTSIAELDLTPRAYATLYFAGYETVGQLMTLRQYDLMCLRHCGKTTAREIAEKLERLTGHKLST